jgi:N-dimethylarginine dimethylaminohydrolase
MNILMVRPDYYEVAYAINAHMRDSDGNIHKVNKELALAQWSALKQTFEKVGAKVFVLEGQPNFPDMVFCANQCFPFKDSSGKKTAVLSKMRHPERKGEVPFFRSFLESQGYVIFDTPDSVPAFEGMGDAILVPGRQLIVGGFGPRTAREIYPYLSQKFGFEVIPLELSHPDYYHLDTCLTVLDSNTVAYVPSAIKNSHELEKFFPRRIEISESEAKLFFAGNAFCIDGRSVILQQGAKNFCNELRGFNYVPVEVDTREFIKAGGSVFCMKMHLV